jgi:hypothetical protein
MIISRSSRSQNCQLRTFVLDTPGMARLLSFPEGGDDFFSSNLSSYRVRQGVLHNPRSDRRTTQGIFHISEGGLANPSRQEGGAARNCCGDPGLRVFNLQRN